MPHPRMLCALGLISAMSCAPEEEQASWLFVIHAWEANLSTDTLMLSDVQPQVIAFTDRPDRLFGTLSMEELADRWAEGADSFADDPPNAVLSGLYTDEDGNQTQCASEVELLAAPVAGSEGEWVFEVFELARWEGCPTSGEATLTDASLFIDEEYSLLDLLDDGDVQS